MYEFITVANILGGVQIRGSEPRRGRRRPQGRRGRVVRTPGREQDGAPRDVPMPAFELI